MFNGKFLFCGQSFNIHTCSEEIYTKTICSSFNQVFFFLRLIRPEPMVDINSGQGNI